MKLCINFLSSLDPSVKYHQDVALHISSQVITLEDSRLLELLRDKRSDRIISALRLLKGIHDCSLNSHLDFN